uniref:Leucine rich repeat transmembrane neuronal 2 n=1 Tax=Capra hircus TaxID=9925 RepID=A0A8C2PGR6_CAPHI
MAVISAPRALLWPPEAADLAFTVQLPADYPSTPVLGLS